MKIVDTFTAHIYIGFKERYEESEGTLEEAELVCQSYCDTVGLYVTITPTRFIYTGGNENGCIVGLINYPRFPSTPEAITKHAILLAEMLKSYFGQYRVSIVTTDKTYMIGEED